MPTFTSLAFGEITSFSYDKEKFTIDESVKFIVKIDDNEKIVKVNVLNPNGESQKFLVESSDDGPLEFDLEPDKSFSVEGIYKITAHLEDQPIFNGLSYLIDFSGSEGSIVVPESWVDRSDASIKALPSNCEKITSENISAVFCDDNGDVKISEAQNVPKWIKQISTWWSQGNSSDREFLESLLFLAQNKKINIHESLQNSQPLNDKVPKWLKNTVAWWGENKISEREFLNAVEYLLDKKIIQIKN